MKEVIKRNKGITLIALIITIIILIILTAITINNVIGTDLIGFASKAAGNYIDAGKEEEREVNKLLGIANGSCVDESSKVKAGEKVEAKEPQDSESIKNNYTDITGRHATVPVGFKVSTDPLEQLVEDGLVIEDDEGNEFVWVPCYVDGGEGANDEGKVKYEKHTYQTQDDTNGSTEEKDATKWRTYYYTKFNDWTDEATKSGSGYGTESVKKYGGFYIARYEAGWSGDPEVKVQAGTNYVDSWSAEVKKLNVTNQKPVSKKGVFSWNFISQTNAKTVSESMYKKAENEDVTDGNVQSKLVDGAAWDTITNWIANTGVDVTKSSTYGNYNDTNKQYTGLYAKHIWAQHKSPDTTDHWLCAKKFSYGTITLKSEAIKDTTDTSKANDYADTGISNGTSHTFWTRYEIPTGSVEDFKLKNIYDLAGNMWEWTTEVGGHKEATESSSTASTATTNGSSFVVVRGGGFHINGTFYPLCYREGPGSSTDPHVPVGFRVVLYIK